MATRVHEAITFGETPPRPPLALHLDNALAQEIVAHLERALPDEGCGLLGVTRDADGTATGRRFYAGTNVDRSPVRYTMDPAEVFAAFRDLTAHDWLLGAIVHGHPATPPAPSPTDLREAYYPEALMLIVSFAGAAPEMRAWRITGARPHLIVVETPLLIRSLDDNHQVPADDDASPDSCMLSRHGRERR